MGKRGKAIWLSEKAALECAGARRNCNLRTKGAERGPEWLSKTSVGKPDGNWEAPDVTDAVPAVVRFPPGPKRMQGWVYISSGMLKECSNIGPREGLP